MANTVYANKIIEAKAKDLLTTAVNARTLMSIDNSLTQEAGMTKTINVYTYTGEAEELAAGEGNSTRGSIAYVGKDYTVKMVQQAFDYQDEDFLKDIGQLCFIRVGLEKTDKDKTFILNELFSVIYTDDDSFFLYIVVGAWDVVQRKQSFTVQSETGRK